MPAVSVIVPVYNTKPLLPRCVAPLQALTWQGFEVWLRGGRDRRRQKNSSGREKRLLRMQQAFFECPYFFS